MAVFQWDDSLSVGIAEIDRQHKQLVEMIGKLNDEMRQGKGKDVLEKILIGMVNYALMHFETEEKYFLKYGYADAENHSKVHQAFVAKVGEFRKDYASGRKGLTIEVMDFLMDWLQKHIKGEDKKYAPFLISKGLR
ncbi:MAG: bacteriohemerythrin [Smithellaceae bacterium]